MYPPNNLCVYVAAITGYNAGLIAGRNQPTDPNENDYNDGAERADFFGQAVDTVWGVASYTNADLQQIENAATAMLASGRSIVPGAAGLTAAGYIGIATALVAGVQAGTRQIVAEGINPNGCGGGGGGTVTSVTGSAPIVITGSAANPNVTITAATDGAAGSMSATDKTKLDGITVGNVGAIYDQNTASNQGSGGPTIVALIQLTVKGSGRFRFSAKANATVVSGDTSQWTLTTQSGTGAVTTTGGATTGSSNGIVPTTGVALVSNSGVPGTGIVITGGNGLDTQTIATEGGGTTIGAGATLLDKFNASGVLQNGNNGPFAPSGSNVFLILSYTNSNGNRQIGDIVLSLEEE
jgi:hypothetical protein